MLSRLMRVSFIVVACALWLIAPAFAASCESVASLALPDGKITSATLVDAGAFSPPQGFAPAMPFAGPEVFKSLPTFCRVTATLTPTPDSDIKIEVWLPAENWNGKLVGLGNGVWAGNIMYSAMAEPVARGYAAAATDTGHVGSGLDVDFAVGHPEKLVDFGYRAVHEMTVKAKMIIESYYGRKERRSLWVSCSTGGRQGLMEAYRYPEDYNGISSMTPGNPMVPLLIGTLWTGYAALKNEESRIPPPKLAVVHKAFIAACDDKDGLEDGIVEDPEHCSFDPGMVQCKDDVGTDCLTAAQVTAMREIYAGVRNSKTGEKVFSGYEPGSEMQLAIMIGGKEPFSVATSYFRGLVFHDPQWDFRSFDYDKDIAASLAAGSEVLDVPSDGLARFLKSDGKLLLSHGWSDGLIPAGNTVDFYKSMIAKTDSKTARESFRLFMIPGMGHCMGGDAPYVTDMLGVIDEWVENKKAPDTILASRPPGTRPVSRPLCPYPQIARYKGEGSTDDAANFECRAD